MVSNALQTVENSTDIITFTDSQVDLIKRQIAKGATPDEFELFLYQCKRTGLDPLARQIYFQKYNNKMAIVTGIDGYRLIADMTGVYAGNEAGVFEGVVKQNWKTNYDSGVVTAPKKATVTVWKIVKGTRMPFTATAYWSEYFPEKRPQMWVKMPMTMLEKCAEAKALRKAFPANLSGIYTSEEMEQAHNEPVRVVGGHENVTYAQTKKSTMTEETIEGEIIEDKPVSPPRVKKEKPQKKNTGNDYHKFARSGDWIKAIDGITRYAGDFPRFMNVSQKILEGGINSSLLTRGDKAPEYRVAIYDAVFLYAECRDNGKDEYEAQVAVHESAEAIMEGLGEILKPISISNVEDIPSASGEQGKI